MASVRHWVPQAHLLLVSTALIVEAAPTPAGAVGFSIRKRQSSSSSGGSSGDSLPTNSLSPKVWVPAVVVVLVLLGIFCFIWTRTSVVNRMRGVVSRSNNTSGSRDVTAAQLAGNSNAANANANNRTANRRTRRNRRRASQVSTSSLPVYMKEPGDMELVIFRGPEEMDASDMIAEAREAEDDEEDTDDQDPNRDQTDGEERIDGDMQENRMSGLLAPAVTLIHPDASMQSLGAPSTLGEDPDTSTTQLLANAPANGHQRSDSGDTTASASTSSLSGPALLQRVSEVPSEAPPGYDSNSDHRHSASSANMDPPGLVASANTGAGPSTSGDTSAQARPRSQTPNTLSSRLSRILHIRSGSGASDMSSATNPTPSSSSHVPLSGASPEPPEPAHVSGTAARSSSPATNREMAMNTNLTSVVSLNEPPPTSSGSTSRPPVSLHQHLRHRSSQSGGSTSTLNLVLPFRSISRQRSSNTLAHQRSMASLNSVSGSNVNLTSPSLLSLSIAQGTNPISTPLSHTLVKTEIRYPAGGPTPDQIKLLSSREGFERFAMPYGEEAIAHAQKSRIELVRDPPPVFESPTTEVGRSAAREAREANERAETSAGEQGDEPRGSVGSEGPDPDAIPESLLTSSREAEIASAAIDARVFVPMFM